LTKGTKHRTSAGGDKLPRGESGKRNKETTMARGGEKRGGKSNGTDARTTTKPGKTPQHELNILVLNHIYAWIGHKFTAVVNLALKGRQISL